jgi:hypothetical protein
VNYVSELTDDISFDEANWVALAWMKEDGTDYRQNELWGKEDLLNPTRPSALHGDEVIDIGITTIRSLASEPRSQECKDLTSHQDINSNSSRPSIKSRK